MAVVASKRAESRARYYVREEAKRLGWDVRHPSAGGRFLEEQEIVSTFPALRSSLGDERPDFVVLDSSSRPCVVIECKNDFGKMEQALKEAKDYADKINGTKGFAVRIAVGVAGSPDTFVQTRCAYLTKDKKWVALQSHGYMLTQLPTLAEVTTALENNDGTTDVQLPDEREFYDAAIRISVILRDAKIEEPVRPKIVGAIILALYQGDFSFDPATVLEHINLNVSTAIDGFDGLDAARKKFLTKTLELSTESHSLRSRMAEIVHQLERLNVRSIMRSGVDFLGQFYEAFLRYGGSTKNLGIVFTPRHITRFCAELVQVQLGQKVYDPASGTGGFLVAAFDRMISQAHTAPAKRTARESLFGCDTNATVWALAVLNMVFRGDGKSNLMYKSCFDDPQPADKSFQRVLLNPPYSQQAEPEYLFINHGLEKLEPNGELVVVVKTALAVDDEHKEWRKSLIANHHILAVISMPAQLFYPAGAPTVVMIIRAHTPDLSRGTFVAKVHNDGFTISKNRRVPISGSQLEPIAELLAEFRRTGNITTVPGLACVVPRSSIADGGEVCAERWLPSGIFDLNAFEEQRRELVRQLSMAVSWTPEIVDELMPDFDTALGSGPVNNRPAARTTLDKWFELSYGMTTQAGEYPQGSIPYISSGEDFNSIDRFLEPPISEVYDTPHITVTGFGSARLQPWKFCARGGAGSAVRVLKPRFAMTTAELMWFASQINAEKWRIYYGRMISLGRLRQYEVDPPPADLPAMSGLIERLVTLRNGLDKFCEVPGVAERRANFQALAEAWKAGRRATSSASKMAQHPAYQQIIAMGQPAVPFILRELEQKVDHWFIALQTITGESPVPGESRGNMAAMAAAWLEWGRSKGVMN